MAGSGMARIKPMSLRQGSKIGVVLVSSPLSGKKRDIILGGCQRLKSMGFEVVLGKTMCPRRLGILEPAKKRAEDLMRMITNDSVDAVFFAWGGESGAQTLPFLDFRKIRKHPKVFMGHSDPTTILNPIFSKTGLITFYGHFASSFNPAWKWFSSYDEKMLRRILVRPEKSCKIPPSSPRETYRAGKAEGIAVGGCITDITKLLGTKYAPDFRRKILFLESYFISPESLAVHLTHLRRAGAFDRLNGLVLGNFMLEGLPPGTSPKKALKEIFLRELREFDFPILKTVDFGHNSHMAPIPVGGMLHIDSTRKQMQIAEPCTRAR